MSLILLAVVVPPDAQALSNGTVLEPVVELSEAVLEAYEAGDWPRVQGYLGDLARAEQPLPTLRSAIEQQESILGRPERIVLYETEAQDDGCAMRRYAVRFETGLGRLEMRLCLEEDTWRLRSLAVLPDTVFTAEYLLTDVLPQQAGIQMMFAHCEQDAEPEADADLHCLGVTAAGETLSSVLEAAQGGGNVEIVSATVAAESPPDPTREVLEPVVRELLERYDRSAAGEIRDGATPGFRESADRALLEQLLADLHQALGPARKVSWHSQEADPGDGLPIVRLAVQFEDTEGEAWIKLVPFNGGWAVHHFKITAPEESTANRILTQGLLLRLARQLTLDPNATIDCPLEKVRRLGSATACKVTSRGRTLAVEAHRSAQPPVLGQDDLTLTCDDLQIALASWLVELERPLGWEVRSLTCDAAIGTGESTTCVARHDQGTTRFQVRATGDRRVRIVGVENLQ